MHLAVIDQGLGLKQRLILVVIRLLLRSKPPDVAKTLIYSSELFGKPFGELCHTVLRGPSEWSTGERELFAAFTARLNACRF